MTSRRSIVALAAVTAVLLAGCGVLKPGSSTNASGATNSGGDNPSAFADFSDLPMPAGAKLNIDNSLVMGSASSWYGRLALDCGQSAIAAVDFYRKEMPRFGWQNVAMSRSSTTSMTYLNGERVATINIQTAGINASRIDITLSPAGQSARQSPADGGDASPPKKKKRKP